MPIYEYVCTSCGYDFERMQSFSADPVTVCPRCRGKVRRRISPVGVIFKGSGWYITDSKRQLSGGTAKSGRQLGDKGEAAAATTDVGSDAGPSTKDAAPKPAESKASKTGKRAKSGGAAGTGQ